jgi:cyclophilin family peptidyl-prolyl cis-trans isomerase
MNFKIIGTALLIYTGILATSIASQDENTMVILKTSMGNIKLELYADKAPATVENFLKYVDDGFYKGTIFHRVIDSFMIQGGGFDSEMSKKKTRAPIKNEADNGLKNERGTIAMARTMIPDSATAQFFINTVDNRNLDFKNHSRRGIGYCVFGRVVEGMDVVDKIRAVKTGSTHGMRDVPQTAVVIKEAARVAKTAKK